MRALVIVSGLACALLFPILELGYKLYLYGDGAIFAYGVAARDSWNIHWHNIPVRAFAYSYAIAPAEALVSFTGNAKLGIAAYALLRAGAQLIGLLLTYAIDRSRNRILFTMACASTALLCPLVAGFPTEMWIAHALYWPMLALVFFAPPTLGGFLLLLGVVIALFLSHEGGIAMSIATLVLLALDSSRRSQFGRYFLTVAVALTIWLAVKSGLPAEEYVAKVIRSAAFNLINVDLVIRAALVLPIVAATAFMLISIGLRPFVESNIRRYWASGMIVAAALTIYWLNYDHSLNAEGRYYLRTILILATPALGLVATFSVMSAAATSSNLAIHASQWLTRLPATALSGAFVLVLLVHAVETTKFIVAWGKYINKVKDLSGSAAQDDGLGDPQFVSAVRLGAQYKPLAWASTTPYLSVLLAPADKTFKLVVDPQARFFWFSCELAASHVLSAPALPVLGRQMVRHYACLADRSWPSIGLRAQSSLKTP